MDTGSAPAWKRLERLLAEHYREQGYEVAAPATPVQRRQRGGAAFWLTLRRGDEHLLLQCRRAAHRPVTHQEIGELQQAIARGGANGAILITGGSFSTAARAAALRQERLQLVDGAELHLLFNLAIVDALKQALELEQEPGFADGAEPAPGAAAPLPFYADPAAAFREDDWAPQQERTPAPPPPRRWMVLIMVAAVAALAGGWLYKELHDAALQVPAQAGTAEAPASRPSSTRDTAPLPAVPGRIHEQARQRVIALEGVTSAAWLSNGALLLGMRDTNRAGQERAAHQACAILARYPTLSGMVIEVQDTGGGGDGRNLQVSCL